MIGIRAAAGLRVGIPVDPDAPDARQWLREELAKAPYQAARPTWFDRVSKAFLDWLNSLTAPTGPAVGDWIPVVLTVLLVAAIVTALLIFGRPRRGRRSHLPADLFGEDDRRSADDMRRAAAAAAARGDWGLAGQEAFRALARGLVERTVLTVTPGTTAHAFAVRAALAFPAEQARLAGAAEVFDRVRYLGAPGTEPDYLLLSALERDLRDAKPMGLGHPAPTVPR